MIKKYWTAPHDLVKTEDYHTVWAYKEVVLYEDIKGSLIEWHSVEAELPNSPTIVLSITPSRAYFTAWYLEDNAIWFDYRTGLEMKVSYWAYLPKPPKEK